MIHYRLSPRANAGFTLIEAVIVIVIAGILASVVAVFVINPVSGYANSAKRAELTDAADVALRRISRDARLALPNSMRVSGACVEFIMTSSGNLYRDPTDGSTSGNFLSFTDTTNKTFDVVGSMPTNPPIVKDDYIVIYNLGPNYNPANAYNYDRSTDACRAGGCNIAKVAANPVGNTISLTANPFAAQSPPLPSPNSRFQVVPGATQAISYVCSGGQLKRYSNYGFSVSQACPPSGTGAVLAGSGTAAASCSIEYTNNATGRNGLLLITLTLSDSSSAESVSLFQQIHIDSSP